ncbi:response regulator [Roseimaritima sediminicola]|uniref:response regulator n=1 Tax=Roseimaritima sediminicola TaxID=2662066 RepID=UPI0012984901|nr:response regulator [Roseimaritima sediminicola]
MTKIVVDCGNCGPDFNSIRQMLKSSFNVKVVQTHGAEDTLAALKQQDVALVTVNRKLDRDYTDGLEVIRTLKADPEVADVPVMLVTNYDEHQDTAVAEGAIRGFGKLSLNDPQTQERLQAVLG